MIVPLGSEYFELGRLHFIVFCVLQDIRHPFFFFINGFNSHIEYGAQCLKAQAFGYAKFINVPNSRSKYEVKCLNRSRRMCQVFQLPLRYRLA